MVGAAIDRGPCTRLLCAAMWPQVFHLKHSVQPPASALRFLYSDHIGAGMGLYGWAVPGTFRGAWCTLERSTWNTPKPRGEFNFGLFHVKRCPPERAHYAEPSKGDISSGGVAALSVHVEHSLQPWGSPPIVSRETLEPGRWSWPRNVPRETIKNLAGRPSVSRETSVESVATAECSTWNILSVSICIQALCLMQKNENWQEKLWATIVFHVKQRGN
jgi:hypothetical protein